MTKFELQENFRNRFHKEANRFFLLPGKGQSDRGTY